MILPLSRPTRRMGGRQHHSISARDRYSKANTADAPVTIATLDGSEGDICFAVCAKASVVVIHGSSWLIVPFRYSFCLLTFIVPQVRQYTKILNRVRKRCSKPDAYAFRREIGDLFAPSIRKS